MSKHFGPKGFQQMAAASNMNVLSKGHMQTFQQSGFDMNLLRKFGETSLTRDAWKQLDDSIVQIARDRLVLLDLYRRRNLIRTGVSLGKVTWEWQTVDDMTPATISMIPGAEGEKGDLAFSPDGVPIPIVHKSYELELRRALADQTAGSPLDDNLAATSARIVADEVESMFINGTDVSAGGYTLDGFVGWSGTTTVSGFAGAWDTTPANIEPDIYKLLAAADANKKRGPFALLVTREYHSALRKRDRDDNENLTYRQKILENPEIEEILMIPSLPDDTVIMFQMTRDSTEALISQNLINVPWSNTPFMAQHKVIWAGTLRLNQDANSVGAVFKGVKPS